MPDKNSTNPQKNNIPMPSPHDMISSSAESVKCHITPYSPSERKKTAEQMTKSYKKAVNRLKNLFGM